MAPQSQGNNSSICPAILADELVVTIDLIIVNYKTPQDLAICLRSLDQYGSTMDATLTLVDVGTENHESVLPWAGGDGTLIGVADNIGYGRACNLAAARGHGEILGFFNADIEFTADLPDCHDAFSHHSDWAILGPRQIDGQHRIRHAGIFGTHAAPRHRGWNELDTGQYHDIRDAVTVAGSAYFIRRSIWDDLTVCPLFQDIAPGAAGAFLPTAHYYEETWLSYHAAAHGHPVTYYGPSTLIHQWHRASPLGGWADQQMPVSREYFRAACEHHDIDHD
jgi:GT2 family glycosyltransferase